MILDCGNKRRVEGGFQEPMLVSCLTLLKFIARLRVHNEGSHRSPFPF